MIKKELEKLDIGDMVEKSIERWLRGVDSKLSEHVDEKVRRSLKKLMGDIG